MSASIQAAQAMMRDATRIASFSGAGLSAESGVPTFRDAATNGLWEKFDPMMLASIKGFEQDPKTVIEWYGWRRRMIANAQPNSAHRALASRDDITHVTQNVDDLLHRAGATCVIQLHGTIMRDHCSGHCGFDEAIDAMNPPMGLRLCACGAYLRPSVVWFGEALPVEEWSEAERAVSECDVLLVIGTSAEVYPAAGLVHLARSRGAKIIVVNTNSSGASGLADVELIGKAGDIVPTLLAT